MPKHRSASVMASPAQGVVRRILVISLLAHTTRAGRAKRGHAPLVVALIGSYHRVQIRVFNLKIVIENFN
jgi:hypothetical protein